MNTAIKVALFLVLLTNSLTLSGRPVPFEVYTVDLALVAFLPLVALWAMTQRRPIGVRPQLIDLVFLLLLAAMMISFAFSVNPTQSLTGAMDWLRIVSFYFACRLIVGSVITDRTITVILGLMAIFLLGLGVLQTATGLPIGLLANYVGENRGDFFWYRVSGPTPNSNVFAMWLTIYGGFVIAVTLRRNRTFAFFVSLSLILIVLIATQSRGGVLGFAVFLLVLLWMNRSRLLSRGIALGAVGLMIVMVGLTIASTSTSWSSPLAEGVRALVERQSRVTDFSEGGERRELMETGLDLLTQPKVFMVGCGAYGMIRAAIESGVRVPIDKLDLSSSSGEGYRTGVHNVWIATAVENGVIAAILLLSIFFIIGLRLVLWRRRGDSEAQLWTSYLLAVLAWYLLVASQVYLMATRVAILLPVVLLGSMALSNREPREPEDDRDSRAEDLGLS